MADEGKIVQKEGVVWRREAAATRRTSHITVVGMKEANHFRTLVCFVMHKRGAGKIYSNFANATASLTTCVML